MDRKRLILAGLAALMLGLWARNVATIVSDHGFFNWVGGDYALFATGARLLFSDRPAQVYDIDAVARTLLPYADYYGPAFTTLNVGPLPYPAPLLLLYAPFAWLSPLVGYALWCLANFVLALAVVRTWTARFPGPPWLVAAVVTLSSFPLMYTLLCGQPIIVMLLAFSEAYRALERRRDFRAGLWLGVLFLKVQYPAILILVLLGKRRWRALGGLAVAGMAIFGVSLAFFGPSGLAAYLATVRSMSGFRVVQAIIYPQDMINIRAILIHLLPMGISETQGKVLTTALSALVASSLLIVWCGPWEPEGPRFDAQMLATMAVTVLTSYHSHMHGATLLLVPALALMARGTPNRALRAILLVGLFVPTPLFALTLAANPVSFLHLGLLLTGLFVIVAESGIPGSLAASKPDATRAGLGVGTSRAPTPEVETSPA